METRDFRLSLADVGRDFREGASVAFAILNLFVDDDAVDAFVALM